MPNQPHRRDRRRAARLTAGGPSGILCQPFQQGDADGAILLLIIVKQGANAGMLKFDLLSANPNPELTTTGWFLTDGTTENPIASASIDAAGIITVTATNPVTVASALTIPPYDPGIQASTGFMFPGAVMIYNPGP